MAQNASAAALKALTDWWEEMGVEPNQAEIEAVLRASQASLIPAQAGTSGRSRDHSAPDPRRRGDERTSRRRQKNKSLEDWIAEAESLAAGAESLPALKAAIESFDGCPLKQLCEKTVVYDGTLGAPVMVLGEGPGGQEDRQGLPFVGKAGQLLDKMLAAIQLDRKTNTFISNVNYWRPPGNRNPEADELAVCRPFVNRMVDLAQPKIIIATGGVAAKSLLDTKTGIMRLRGSERPFETPAGTTVPLVPMFHPAYLLRRPQDKSRAWRDLLLVQARLKEMGVEM
ncbi:MAG: uracil-DNA glycosylase [Hyphomonadaceae bacterium]|nr:uracil-DNA glycosylase [Hyphomonadaceae bacterium]